MEDVRSARVAVDYDGRTREIFRLSLWVGFLTLITLGIFRFWATTRVRRWFWSRITIDGERLEYSGTGFELFVAFVKVALLLAIVLVPLRLALNFYGPNVTTAAIIGFVQLALIAILYVFAIYYARRYRLTRTQWHGIRANLVGSSWSFLSLNIGYLLLTFVTLGLAYPYYRVATRRYLLDHTWFGDRKFSCTASARSLMLRWVIYWLVGLAFLGVVGFQASMLAMSQKNGVNPVAMTPEIEGLAAVYFVTALLLGFFFIAYRVAEFRVLAGGLTFQGVGVTSNLSAWRILLFALKLYGVILLWSGALLLVVGLFGVTVIRKIDPSGAATAGHMNPASVAAIIFFVVAYLLSISVFMRAYYMNGLLRRVIASLSFDGGLDLARIGQTTAPVPRWGEGMLEAFDFAG